MPHTLPAGLLNNEGEFFAQDNNHGFILCNSRVTAIQDLPEEVLQMVEAQIPAHKMAGLNALGFTGRVEIILHFLTCNYGRFDHKADIVAGVLQEPEYWACEHRGKCPQEGIVCEPLRTSTGEKLSPREVQVMILIASGELDKSIAHHLGISIHTVTTHNKNLRLKTGAQRKSDLTRIAAQLELI